MFELSVIVPVYNGENYLEIFLDSLTKQNVEFMEVIIVNDGSIDTTEDIIKKYCEKYDYWRYVNNIENKGLNASRNIGLRESKGDYVIFCDADDYIPENVFNKMLKNNDSEDYDIITGQVRKFSDELPSLSEYDYDESNGFYIWEDDINKFIFSNITHDTVFSVKEYPKIISNLSPWCNLVKRSLIKDYFDETQGYSNSEGGLFYIPLLFNAKKIKILNEPVYYWRYNQSSLSVNEGLSKDKLMYIFKELMLINVYDENIADVFFNMILTVILPAFLSCDDNNHNNNYY